MGKKKYSVENIVSTLREIEVLTGSGQPLKEVLRQIRCQCGLALYQEKSNA